MEKEYDKYDCLRYEIFETLIPVMLYEGTEKEKDDFFGFLMQDGKTLIHDMYQIVCEDDGLPYPYEKKDFEVEILERGGVNILQILLPTYNPNINDILRAYILFTKREDSRYSRRYFVIKRFENGNIFNLYVSSKIEKILGEELTGHSGDMEYEYWKLVYDYAKVMIQEIRVE